MHRIRSKHPLVSSPDILPETSPDPPCRVSACDRKPPPDDEHRPDRARSGRSARISTSGPAPSVRHRRFRSPSSRADPASSSDTTHPAARRIVPSSRPSSCARSPPHAARTSGPAGAAADGRSAWPQSPAPGGSRSPIRAFCREQAIGEHSFYSWRKRLRGSGRVPFALVETKPAAIRPSAEPVWTIEVSLADGAVIRVANGADPSTLRAFLETLRGSSRFRRACAFGCT